MAKPQRTNANRLAVSAAAQETSINTAATLDSQLRVEVNDVINLMPRRENNAEEATGLEEPSQIYDLGATSEGALNFTKAKPESFAFLGAFALGTISSAAAGAGYQHTISPIEGEVDEERSNPTFTLGMRYGNQVAKRLYYSMVVDSLTAKFARDAWVSCTGNLKGTGKYADNIQELIFQGDPGLTSLTFTDDDSNDYQVEGSTAAERLDSVQRIRVQLKEGNITAFSDYSGTVTGTTKVTSGTHGIGVGETAEITITGTTNYDGDYTATGIDADNYYIVIAYVSDDAAGAWVYTYETAWTEVEYTAISNADPAVATIVAPQGGGTDDLVRFKVLFIELETDVGAWAGLIDSVEYEEETPLRVSECTFYLGGKWNGTTFVGGKAICPEMISIEWTFSNNFEIQFTACQSGDYAGRIFRPQRDQKISLNREFRDYLVQMMIENNESTGGLYITATGDAIDDSNNYEVILIFPKIAILESPIGQEGKVLSENASIQVLQDATYGSVILKVKNKVATYAA